MLKEFREFISKGNMLDLAVGVIIGAAFGAIINSLVKDIINPLIGLAGKANFDNMFLVLRPGEDPKLPPPYATPDLAQKAGAVTLNYGMFLTNLLNFIIVAFVIFLIIKAVNKMKREPVPVVEAKPAAPSNEEVLLTEIRDLLKSKA